MGTFPSNNIDRFASQIMLEQKRDYYVIFQKSFDREKGIYLDDEVYIKRFNKILEDETKRRIYLNRIAGRDDNDIKLRWELRKERIKLQQLINKDEVNLSSGGKKRL